jgi:DNA-binding transcriptional MerR regulator/uncharacterized protein (DUF1330 family)
LTLP